MPDYAHEALERHIDTQHPDLARHLTALANLQKYIEEASHNYRDEPDANISSYAPARGIITSDLVRELTLAGYAYNVTFPFSTALTANTAGTQFSLFNNGAKTVIVDQIDCTTIAAAAQFYLQAETSDPSLTPGTTFTGIVGSTNSKLSVASGASSISATFTPTPAFSGTPSRFIDVLSVPINQTQFMFSEEQECLILPAGAKIGILLTVTTLATGSLVTPHFHLIELP